ncbi:MAG: undecaprenyl-phosphate glucose phosphotransferase [Gallionellaceae bacterium]|jgi:putative colanic acid biosynthesis UDP-glucose lipid carrier transferase
MPNSFLRPHSSRVSFLQRLLDVGIVFSVYWLVISLHEVAWNVTTVVAVVLALTSFLLFAEMRGLYRSWRVSPLIDEIREVVFIWLMVVITLLTLAYVTKSSYELSLHVVLTWFALVPLGLILVRLLIRWTLRYARRYGANLRSVAIVGNNPIGHRLVNHLRAMPWAGLQISGVFDNKHGDYAELAIGQHNYPLGSIEDLVRQVEAGEIDSVYVALPLTNERRIEAVVNQLSDSTASVYVVPDLFVSELMHARWIDFGGMPLVSVYETPFYGLYGWVKRLEDIIFATLILLIISPILLGIAIAVKTTSPGSILFKQRRYGLNGAVVEVWKFRSMTVCDDGAHVVQAKKNDARITPLGAFLRKTSLDELPQFINVLQGTMSVVGPRPHAVAHNEQYRKLIKGYMLRHKVKPGITGWAQVNGWRGETDTLDKMQKRVEYDLEYIQNWSLWLDIKIVFLTVFKGFSGKNAY